MSVAALDPDAGWWLRGLCRHPEYSPEWWFATHRRSGDSGRCLLDCPQCQARRICRTCPVVWECFDDAMAVEQRVMSRWGIRAGLSGSERAEMAQRRTRDTEDR